MQRDDLVRVYVAGILQGTVDDKVASRLDVELDSAADREIGDGDRRIAQRDGQRIARIGEAGSVDNSVVGRAWRSGRGPVAGSVPIATVRVAPLECRLRRRDWRFGDVDAAVPVTGRRPGRARIIA